MMVSDGACLAIGDFSILSMDRTMTWICPSAMSKCSYIMLQWLDEYFQRSDKART